MTKLEELEKIKLKVKISKAKASIEEIECKILEREIDIERMREHIELQKTEIKKAEEEFAA